MRGFHYDEVNAVLASGWSDLADLEARLDALQQVRPTADFEPLAASFKRIRNILKQAGVRRAPATASTKSLLEPGPERDLYEDLPCAITRPADRELGAIASLRPKVDLFFDKVLVNAPDAKRPAQPAYACCTTC